MSDNLDYTLIALALAIYFHDKRKKNANRNSGLKSG